MAEPTAPAQPPANAPAPPAAQGATAQSPAAPAAPAAQPAQGQQPAVPAAAQPALPPGLQALLAGQPLAVGVAPLAQPAQPAAMPTPAPEKPAAPPKADPAEEVAKLRAQVNGAAIRDAIHGAAVKAQAIAPDQVVTLLREELDVDAAGRVFVKADPRADVGAHVGKYLAANLHLLKTVVHGGGAGSPATVQAPGAAQPLNPHTREGGTQVVHGLLGRLFPTPTAPATGGAAATR